MEHFFKIRREDRKSQLALSRSASKTKWRSSKNRRHESHGNVSNLYSGHSGVTSGMAQQEKMHEKYGKTNNGLTVSLDSIDLSSTNPLAIQET